jgi:hypothetical protein
MRPSITTVVTPAVSRDLVTLADVREQLQIKPNDTAQDVWLAKVISRASRQAEQYCNRIFAQQGYQDLFGAVSGIKGAPLILSQAPAVVSGVTVDGTALDSTSAYIVDSDAALVYNTADSLWQSTSSILVAYTGGFTAVPDDVQMAAIEMCVMEYRSRTRDPMLRESETPGLGRQTFWVGPVPGQTLPGNLGPALEPYRRGGIG